MSPLSAKSGRWHRCTCALVLSFVENIYSELNMKKLALAEWASVAEVVGTIGVIVSLVFVVHSINVNTNEVRASYTHLLFDTTRQIELTVASDAEWSRIIVQGRTQQEQLSDVEQHRYDAYLSAMLDLWAEMLDRYDDGLVEEQMLADWDTYFTNWVQHHLTESDWTRIEWGWPGPIRSRVESALLGAQRD